MGDKLRVVFFVRGILSGEAGGMDAGTSVKGVPLVTADKRILREFPTGTIFLGVFVNT